jgi:hypothetical protein
MWRLRPEIGPLGWLKNDDCDRAPNPDSGDVEPPRTTNFVDPRDLVVEGHNRALLPLDICVSQQPLHRWSLGGAYGEVVLARPSARGGFLFVLGNEPVATQPRINHHHKFFASRHSRESDADKLRRKTTREI